MGTSQNWHRPTMKLDNKNHEFLAQDALTLKVEQDHIIEVFNTTTVALMKSDNDAMNSIEAYKIGKISKDRLHDEINTVSDLAVVQTAYDKLSDAYIEAFNIVSAHHRARMKADPAYVTNCSSRQRTPKAPPEAFFVVNSHDLRK